LARQGVPEQGVELDLDATAALRYHNLTKHSYASIRTNPHFLDWNNFPLPFKLYEGVETVQLPTAYGSTDSPALACIAAAPAYDAEKAVDGKLDINRLAGLLYYSAGVIREKAYPGGTIYFRAAACAGALYPIETYVISIDVEDLRAGVYHFNPRDCVLDRLRDGDFSRQLLDATAELLAIRSARAVLAHSAITWRSAWKYRDRSYRYHFWDNGTILANVLAMAQSYGFPAEIVMGFVDDEIARLIGVDGRHELPLSLVAVSSTAEPHQSSQLTQPGPVPEIAYPTAPLSYAQVEYASILDINNASSLHTAADVKDWRDKAGCGSRPHAGGSGGDDAKQTDLSGLDIARELGESIEQVIARRASTRRFAKKPITIKFLTAILRLSESGFESDFVAPGDQLNDIYVVINRVAGIEPGAYFYDRETSSLQVVKEGNFSDQATYLTLDQDLGGDASATIFFMADLNAILGRLGDRGYRAVQMEAGIIGGKQYLLAYALGLGATGLTFYDDDVTEFFGPHARSKSCIFVVSVGVPGKRPLL
jgi:SagB-type dehydrogenase family enzyme